MKKVIVTDCKYRMAIAPIRELGKKNYNIVSADFTSVPEKELLCEFSKYTKKKIRFREEDIGFVEDIIRESIDERPVLIPVNRKSLVLTINNKTELNKYCDFLVPNAEALYKSDDKKTMYDIAKTLGVKAPRTVSLSDFGSIEEMAENVGFPCIIKFRNGEKMGKKPQDRYKIVNNKEDFINSYKAMHEVQPNPIASDYILGHDIGVAVVMNKDHKAVDFICYESLREYPIEGGPTCFLKTIFDRNLLKYACKLLEKIEFTGIAMLDFRGSIKEPYFLEINPRVWGSANITTISGSGFFESYVKAATGDIEELDLDNCLPKYKIGKKMRFIPQTFACFASTIKRRKGRIDTFLRYFVSFFDFSVRDGLFSIIDPKPFIKYIRGLTLRDR